MLHCPLCTHEVNPYVEDRLRAYFHCPRCELVSAAPESHLDAESEKVYYDLHENDPTDEGYRRFLGRLAEPLLGRLTTGMRGLDYGCGPGPTLSVMLGEAGMLMGDYDPLYSPNPRVLECSYDFVTCTEVVEHFRRPAEDWDRLTALVRPGGWLGVMTKLVISPERFVAWHYKEDPTHVSFYSPGTFSWLGARFGLAVERVDRDVILLQKR
jgi:Methyltransferase domain